MKGKSGVEHQIDVLTSHSDGLHEYLTDIECKFWDQKINKDIVMKVHEIVLDCSFAKGIIVSKLGFTEDAITYAKYEGIGLVELREITDDDWKGRIRYMHVNIEAKYPELLSIQVDAEADSKDGATTKQVCTEASKVEIHYSDGKVVTMKEFIETLFYEKLYAATTDAIVTEKYEFDEGSTIIYNEGDLRYGLRSITLSGKIETISTQEIINGDDHVMYYMRCIFEGDIITIGSDGQIFKH
ncbi:MAG: restriction endonuclease [Aeriscardovia sp.]|nr:restriction endonuclease [Aeriscardovia sp.]